MKILIALILAGPCLAQRIPAQPLSTDIILGRSTAFGTSPWPSYDSQVQAAADFVLTQLDDGCTGQACLGHPWDFPLPGTISFDSQGQTVTGDGSIDMQATFCGGQGSTVHADDGPALVINHGTGGHYGAGIVSCPDSRTLIVFYPIDLPSDSAAGFSVEDNQTQGQYQCGQNSGAGAEYYEGSLTLRSMYYRTGDAKYLTGAQTLEDRYWASPAIDQGYSYAQGDGSHIGPPRCQAFTALVARALERGDMWAGLEAIADFDYGYANTVPPSAPNGKTLGDIREQGYSLKVESLLGFFDPNPGMKAKYAANAKAMIDSTWAPTRLSSGAWRNIGYGTASWNGSPGMVTVTSGSTIVWGSGTNFGDLTGQFFLACSKSPPADNSDCDARSYLITSTNTAAQMFTIDTPYQGNTWTPHGWEVSNLVGVGTEPFELSFVASAFRAAFFATGEMRLLAWTVGIAQYLQTTGYDPSSRGLWYARGFVNCEPNPSLYCTAGDATQARELNAYVLGTFAFASRLQPSLLTFTQELMGATQMSGPYTDGIYPDFSYEINPLGDYKWFGLLGPESGQPQLLWTVAGGSN